MNPNLVIDSSVIDILTNSEIKDYLIRIEPSLKQVFNAINYDSFQGLPKLPYVSLITAIIGQKIRYTQAKRIRSNLYRLCGVNFTLDTIINLKDEHWQYIGIGSDKIGIINRINDYLLKTNNPLTTVTDIKKLKSISGVGDWTIDTVILTSFLDWDIFPSGDLFIRKKVKKLYRLAKVPTISEVKTISQRWSPYRSIVAWHLWRWF